MTRTASSLFASAIGLFLLAAIPATALSNSHEEASAPVDGITCATPPETPVRKKSEKKKDEKQKDKKEKSKKKKKSKKKQTDKSSKTQLCLTA